MKRVLIQDKYNSAKTWEISYLSHGYYLKQFIHGHQYGRGCRVSMRWIRSIGLPAMQTIKVTIDKQ